MAQGQAGQGSREKQVPLDQARKEAPTFSEGQKVLLSAKNLIQKRPGRKLNELYEGPFEITKVMGNGVYELKLPSSMKIHNRFNENLLKPYHEHEDPARHIKNHELPEVESQEDYEVEKILKARKEGRNIRYLVKWKGYPDSENSWASKSTFQGAEDLFADFSFMTPSPPLGPFFLKVFGLPSCSWGLAW